MILTYELCLMKVKMSHLAKYLGQRLFLSAVAST